MLRNLLAEMVRKDVSRHEIADLIDNTYGTVSLKLKGRYEFSVKEAKKIRDTFFPNTEIEYLFENYE